MSTIFKYPLALDDYQWVTMPYRALLRHVDIQAGVLTLWAQVETSLPTRPRQIAIVGTGHLIPEGAIYVGSAQDRVFVWHVFDLGEI